VDEARAIISDEIFQFLNELLEDDEHAKRVH